MNLSKCQLVSFAFIVVLTVVFFLTVYMCNGRDCLGQYNVEHKPTADYEAFLQGRLLSHDFSKADLDKQRQLNFEEDDVLVYLHIQKTGGSSFGKHLVHNLAITPPCKCTPGVKKCECFTKNNRIWLLSRHSTGWVCGLHADWTELNDCVDEWFKKNDTPSRKQRRYHWISFIRHPVDRFLSEWQHVTRGATWKSVRLHCNGRSATIDEVPFCYKTDDWKRVTFEQFMACKHNLAFNRMTRMLADLSRVNCYNNSHLDPEEVGKTLVESAKENLVSFAFFGLQEYQRATQFLFERTFGIQFIDNFEQKHITHIDRIVVTSEMRSKVAASNKLDVLIYQYAKDLFLQRVSAMERREGYSVEEYFNRVRKVKQLRDDQEELFEDEPLEESEIKGEKWYHSKTKNNKSLNL